MKGIQIVSPSFICILKDASALHVEDTPTAKVSIVETPSSEEVGVRTSLTSEHVCDSVTLGKFHLLIKM